MENNDKIRITLKKELLKSEKKEIRKKRIHNITIVVLCIFSLLIGLTIGAFIFNKPSVNGLLINSKTELIKSLLKDNWLYANDYENLDEYLDNQAYYGMTAFKDDPFTTYQSKEENEEFSSSINMNFVGIGVTYQNSNGMALIINVYPNSPASKAGIKAGDIMMKVDDKSIEKLNSDEIKNLVLGEKNKLVKITVKRLNEIIDFNVYRDEVKTTVDSYIFEDIPVLKIMSFGLSSYDECLKYLNEYTKYDRLIIDLRGNTGGYEIAVQEIAGLFLPKNSIVLKAVDKDGNEKIDYTKSESYFDNFKKIVVLTDNSTASASEVLTMALLEQHPDAISVGNTTYGKGVMQSTQMLSDGSALKYTSAKWLSSKDKWINKVGITPNVEVNYPDVINVAYYTLNKDESYKLDSVSPYVAFAQKSLKYLAYDIARVDGYYDETFNNALAMFADDINYDFENKLDKDLYEAIISKVIINFNEDKTNDPQFISALNEVRK